MANRLETETTKIDQSLFVQLYNSAILKIPDKLRREGMKKKNPDYNRVLRASIKLFLSTKGLIKTSLEEPTGDAKALFDNILGSLKVPETSLPENHLTDRQKDLFDLA